jgi:hypothetical protein
MEAPPYLGQLIPEDAVVHRDAIHIAIAPMIAHENLWAGVKVMLVRGSTTHVRQCDPDRSGEAVRFLGIVDPFLDAGGSNEINKGDRVYIYLKPGSINSLRHEWTHPLIAEPVKMAAINKSDEATAEAVYQQLVNGPAKQLLQNFAADIDISYEELMDAASDYHHHGNYLSDGGKFEGVSIPIGFWDAYQAVTGETVPKEDQDNFFSCSC